MTGSGRSVRRAVGLEDGHRSFLYTPSFDLLLVPGGDTGNGNARLTGKGALISRVGAGACVRDARLREGGCAAQVDVYLWAGVALRGSCRRRRIGLRNPRPGSGRERRVGGDGPNRLLVRDGVRPSCLTSGLPSAANVVSSSAGAVGSPGPVTAYGGSLAPRADQC